MVWPIVVVLAMPVAAAIAVAVWFLFPRLRRNGVLRFGVIVSVALTGLEFVVLAFFWAAFMLFTLNGSIEFD